MTKTWRCVSVVLLVWELVSTGVHAQQCSQPLGNSEQTEYTRTNDDLFLLDVDHPAQCDGTVDSLNYCVYRRPPSGNSFTDGFDFPFQAFAAVFRPEPNDVYTRVSNFTTLSQSQLDIDDPGFFGCFDQAVPLTVQTGDVLGVCQVDAAFGLGRLNVIGTGAPSGNSLYVANANMNCGNMDQTLSVNIEDGSLQAMDGYVMHIHSNINVPPTPMPTTEVPPATNTTTTTTQNMSSTTTTQTATSSTTTESTTASSSTESTTATSSVDNSGSSSPEIQPSVTIAPNPLVNQSTATTIPPPVPPQTSGGNNTILIASVVGALSFVALCGAILFIIGTVLVARRKSINSRSALRASLKAGVDNQVYDECIHDEANVYERNGYDDTIYELPEIGAYCNGSDNNMPPTLPEGNYELPVPSRIHTSDEYAEPTSPAVDSHDYEYTDSSSRSLTSGHVYTSPLDAEVFYSELLEQNRQRDIYANQSPFCAPATEEEALYAQLKKFDIRHINCDNIKVVSHLGSGQFGSVNKGVWSRPNDSAVDVALKTLKSNGTQLEKVKLLQEGAIMAQFMHPNILSLYGLVCKGGPIMIVVELAKKGDLRKLLCAMPSKADVATHNTARLLLMFSQQVALGMQYLTSKGFVHRDLAARNILVSGDNICKVADFGMSRDLADEQYYVSHGGKIPVKWTAPEALHFKKYSTASDVWSYGCLLYEIWSIGHKPFEEKKHNEVIQLVDSGYRLPPPPGCPKRVYEFMIAAWHPVSSMRPGFRDVLLGLMQNEEEVLSVNDRQCPNALGAPLDEGEKLYIELQNMYI